MVGGDPACLCPGGSGHAAATAAADMAAEAADRAAADVVAMLTRPRAGSTLWWSKDPVVPPTLSAIMLGRTGLAAEMTPGCSGALAGDDVYILGHTSEGGCGRLFFPSERFGELPT